MNPGVIEGAVLPVSKPAGWNEEVNGHCSTLMVRVEQVQGLTFMTSAWDPSPEEIGYLLAGAKIHLGVSAPAHPTIRMGTGPVPETDAGPVWTIRRTARIDGTSAVRVHACTHKGYAWAEVPESGKGFIHDVATGIEAAEQRLKDSGFL